ncbi:MAG: hypothetical protein HZB26_08120 [Candidatus Hydrogenedentes bacterium]|nr:hypothetical protein [Candidatus Hydrogenedentota bacterium]
MRVLFVILLAGRFRAIRLFGFETNRLIHIEAAADRIVSHTGLTIWYDRVLR